MWTLSASSRAKSHSGGGAAIRDLSRYVRDERLLTLEQAIHELTGMPALRVGLCDRDLLREGMLADIAVFNPHAVQDLATFEMPNQYPTGINCVIVNGRIESGTTESEPRTGRGPLRGTGILE